MLIPFGVFSAAGAGGGGDTNSFDLISTTILSSSQASVTFDVTGLGSTYKHLQIRTMSRNDSGSASTALLRFNSDTGSNYSRHYLIGDGSSVSSGGSGSGTYTYAYEMPNSTVTSGNFGGAIIDILDAFSSSKNKTTRSLFGYAGTTVGLESGAWLSTSATTSLLIYPSAGNFVSGSRFSLYGIKG